MAMLSKIDNLVSHCKSLGHLVDYEFLPADLDIKIRHAVTLYEQPAEFKIHTYAKYEDLIIEIFERLHTPLGSDRHIAVIAGNHEQFERYCNQIGVNPRDPHSGYIEIYSPEKARGYRFTKVIEVGTYLDRKDYQECRDVCYYSTRLTPAEPMFIKTTTPEEVLLLLKSFEQ